MATRRQRQSANLLNKQRPSSRAEPASRIARAALMCRVRPKPNHKSRANELTYHSPTKRTGRQQRGCRIRKTKSCCRLRCVQGSTRAWPKENTAVCGSQALQNWHREKRHGRICGEPAAKYGTLLLRRSRKGETPPRTCISALVPGSWLFGKRKTMQPKRPSRGTTTGRWGRGEGFGVNNNSNRRQGWTE